MINKVVFQGRLTKDPELRYTPSQIAVCSFSLACNNQYSVKKGDDWEKKSDVVYVECIAWKKVATLINKCFSKGDEFIVFGRLRNQQWTSKDGQKRSKLEILVDEIHFCHGKKLSNLSAKDENYYKNGPSDDEYEAGYNDFVLADESELPF